MKDYSEFTKNPSSFITSYEIDNDEIVVNTKKTEKKEPYKYKATKNIIKYYEQKLENQYKTIIHNQDEILKNKTDKRNIIYFIIAIILCILSILSAEFSDLLGMILCGTSIGTLVIDAIDIAIYSAKFKLELKIYDTFIKEKTKIEESSKKDKNITDCLSKKTLENLSKNIELKEQDLIDNIFNIDFMDKTSLKDLRKILNRYMNSEGLSEDIIYKSPISIAIDYIDRAKKRTRKK